MKPHFAMKRLRILVCGDRNWTDRKAIERELDARIADAQAIINGYAPGADKIADELTLEFVDSGWLVQHLRFPADWAKYHRAAGPIRNQQMIDEARPNLVLAFHPDITKSKGTLDMVKRANKAGIKVEIFTS